MSDFRREYAVSSADLVDMSLDEFMWLLQGLSHRSRFQRELADRPKTLHDPAERAELIAAARR